MGIIEEESGDGESDAGLGQGVQSDGARDSNAAIINAGQAASDRASVGLASAVVGAGIGAAQLNSESGRAQMRHAGNQMKSMAHAASESVINGAKAGADMARDTAQ